MVCILISVTGKTSTHDENLNYKKDTVILVSEIKLTMKTILI